MTKEFNLCGSAGQNGSQVHFMKPIVSTIGATNLKLSKNRPQWEPMTASLQRVGYPNGRCSRVNDGEAVFPIAYRKVVQDHIALHHRTAQNRGMVRSVR